MQGVEKRKDVQIMKRYLADAAIALMVFCAAGVHAAINDMTARFSTPGVDCYADGKPVADGECYALVWSPKGAVFSGFNADGTAVSSADRVVLAGSLAKGGRCVDSIFHIPAALYSELDGGEWAVCLVDTRRVDGVPAGVKDGKPVRVNRWGLVTRDVKVEPVAASKVTSAAASASNALLKLGATADGGCGKTDLPARANILSAVPPNLMPPQITAIEVTDSEVWLAVDGTVPYLDYTIVSGKTPNDLKTDYFSEVVEGKAGGEIAIGTVKSPARRFFRVKRAE